VQNKGSGKLVMGLITSIHVNKDCAVIRALGVRIRCKFGAINTVQIRCSKFGANSVQIRCTTLLVGVNSVQMACGANSVQIKQYGANSVQLSGTRCTRRGNRCKYGANRVNGANSVHPCYQCVSMATAPPPRRGLANPTRRSARKDC